MYDKILQLDKELDLGPFDILRCENCGGLNIGKPFEAFLCAWCCFETIPHSSQDAIPA